eukprot:3827904-Pyramimonas_sp.AAC.1
MSTQGFWKPTYVLELDLVSVWSAHGHYVKMSKRAPNCKQNRTELHPFRARLGPPVGRQSTGPTSAPRKWRQFRRSQPTPPRDGEVQPETPYDVARPGPPAALESWPF